MIHFKCHSCGQKIKVEDKKAGTKGRCPKCHTVLLVPSSPPQNTFPATASVESAESAKPVESVTPVDTGKTRTTSFMSALLCLFRSKVAAKPTIACQTCDTGHLQRIKRYRMSAPVVVIGYIFLIPSIIGITISILMFFISGGAVSGTLDEIKVDARQQLESASVPDQIINKVLDFETISNSEREQLSRDASRAVDAASLSLSAGMAGVGIGGALAGGASLCIGVSFFTGGLLGWLLIMKKRILQCNSCGATVAAS